MTDYQAAQKLLETRIAELSNECDSEATPPRPEAAGAAVCAPATERNVRLFFYRFQSRSLAGDLRACGQLDHGIELAIANTAQPGDLWLLRACIALKLHCLADAEFFLAQDPSVLSSAPGRLIAADLHFQHGRYASAQQVLDSVIADEPTWHAFARLAYLSGVLGDVDAAHRLYVAAQDELSAKEMQHFAWLEIQRGFLCFERGRHAAALAHYRRAGAAFSGYWLVEEKLAELAGAQGHFTEAIAAYEALYESSPRPEWAHAIGDLFGLRGEILHAHRWKLEALESYLESVDRGEVHYFHALADLCCELPGRTHEALMWARRDAEIRGNHMTLGDLAWAEFRSGHTAAACVTLEKALAHGAVSARLFTQAACICAASGKAERSVWYMRQAKQINPAPARAKLPSPNMEVRWAS